MFELKEKITFSNFELCRYPLNGVQENRKWTAGAASSTEDEYKTLKVLRKHCD